MTTPFNANEYLGVKFSLRKLLTDSAYHSSTSKVPPSVVVESTEPQLFQTVRLLADSIVASPELILNERYEKEDRVKDWKELCKKKVLENGAIISANARTRTGSKILDHFMPHIFDVQNFKGHSIRNMINKENMVKALLTNVSMHSTPYKSELRRMLTQFCGGKNSITKYKPIVAKAIVSLFNAKRVLDPCIGWGGRMLGSLAAGTDTVYVGCEPDLNTFKGLENIMNDLQLPSNRVTLLNLPAEAAFEQIGEMGKFDMVLTSPPYYNLEIYTSGEQSLQNFPTWESWVELWLKPVILSCLDSLTEHGVSCWSVKDFQTDKKYPLATLVKQIHKDAGWTLAQTVSLKGPSRPGVNRIDKNGKETRESEEETFCFKRAH